MSQELRQHILQELDNISEWSWRFNPVRAAELVTMCENAGFEQNIQHRHRLCTHLINLLNDERSFGKDPIIQQKIEALFLKHLDKDEIRKACQRWEYSQSPLLEDFIERQNWLRPDNWIKYPDAMNMGRIFILFRLKKGWFKDITDMLEDRDFSNYSYYLASGLSHSNHIIRQAALTFFRQLDKARQKVITKAVLHNHYWLSYGEMMDWLAEQKCYPPTNNTVWVVISLINGVFAEYNAENETVIRLLFEIVQNKKYNERRVPDKAKAVIRKLLTAGGRDIFCRLVLDMLKDGKSHKELEALAIGMNYTPSAMLDKILFFFLTCQFEKYDKLDFDRSVMYTVYSTTENKGLRQHINGAVRESGRLDYLDIVTPRTETTDKLVLSRQKTTINVLRANGQWTQLWQKVFEFNLLGSVSAIGVLCKSGWQPGDDYERELFVRLKDIVQSGFINSGLKIEPATLLERPLGVNGLEHLTALKTATVKKAELSPAEQNALSYVEAVLSYRFRHDIEVEFAPNVQPDKFDVELESD
jgi:hypothetical protein